MNKIFVSEKFLQKVQKKFGSWLTPAAEETATPIAPVVVHEATRPDQRIAMSGARKAPNDDPNFRLPDFVTMSSEEWAQRQRMDASLARIRKHSVSPADMT